MVSVPGFLLRRLYRKGSLRNTDEGVEFRLENRLGSGYAQGMTPIAIDGVEIPLQDAAFMLDGTTTPFSAIGKDNTFTLALNKTIGVRVSGVTLAPGVHKIEMGFDVPGLGTLRFDFTDAVDAIEGR